MHASADCLLQPIGTEASLYNLQEEEEKKTAKSAEEITEKYGLEAGLWNVFRSKDAQGRSKGDLAKDLLKRYGSAYLITSISFAIVSFSLCYALVTAGNQLCSKPPFNASIFLTNQQPQLLN